MSVYTANYINYDNIAGYAVRLCKRCNKWRAATATDFIE
jgi:hypothetical protein